MAHFFYSIDASSFVTHSARVIRVHLIDPAYTISHSNIYMYNARLYTKSSSCPKKITALQSQWPLQIHLQADGKLRHLLIV